MRRSMTLEEAEAARERWLRRLLRAANAVEAYNKACKRIAARQKENPIVFREIEHSQQIVEVPKEPADDLSIPAQFLRPRLNVADEAAKAEILAQQEAAKKEKTAARIAKLKADKAGERKRMPLQGKDALKAIFE